MSNFTASAFGVGIHLDSLDLTSPDQETITLRQGFTGEISGVTTDVVQISGPAKYTEEANNDQEVVWLFLDGSA